VTRAVTIVVAVLAAGLAVVIFGTLMLVRGSAGRSVKAAAPVSAQRAARVQAELGRLPLSFVENRGQVDRRVSYFVQGSRASLYFTSRGVTYALTGGEPGAGAAPRAAGRAGVRWAVEQAFVGARTAATPIGRARRRAVVSYFKGRPSQWKTGLPTFANVAYRDLWPGIDLVYSGTGSRLEYSFFINPGARASAIRLAYRGASAVQLNRSGQLKISTPAGGFTDDRPVAYQELNGRRTRVQAWYAPRHTARSRGGRFDYGFRVGAYDRSRPLVLDPAVLVYAGYIGGSADDVATGIAVDGAGNTYVTGYTSSSEASFPEKVGPDLTYNGVVDAFVAKVNAAGTGLVYAGYIGGTGSDFGWGIAVDAGGNAYVAGETSSSEVSFPVKVGPDLTLGGGYDAFVAKISASGTGLVYAGYIGGAGNDGGFGIALDGSGRPYLTGYTESPEASFPVVGGPDLTFNGGINDGFVAKVRATGASLVYAGYIGGDGDDVGYGIAVDGAGSAYVTGHTGSAETTFPVKVGPDLTYNGGEDAFVAKVAAAGTSLVYAGYVGGTGGDSGRGIAVDSTGSAYAVGQTSSDEGSFPVKVGPDLTFNGGVGDAFVAKVTAAGGGLVYAGYVGGAGTDFGYGIAADGGGNAYVTGTTDSTEATFPVTGGPDLTFNDVFDCIACGDAFAAKVNGAGSLDYAGYIGGGANDRGFGVAVDTAGNAYVTGATRSTEKTYPVLGGPDLTSNGLNDAFVAKIASVTCTITGTAGDDTLTGTAGADVICGLGGNDTMDGLGGDDVLLGGPGVDVLDGGPGNDREYGGDGNDTFANGSAADGADLLSGGDGIDTAGYVSRVNDLSVSLDGRPNDGALDEGDNVAPDVENVNGGAANDTIVGNSKINALSGGAGQDSLSGGGGNDRLTGGTENDVENGGDGNDTLVEGGGANGADALNGGAGVDTVTYASRAARVVVSLDGVANDGAVGEGDNVAPDVENVTGGKANDAIDGSSLPNTLVGGLGADTLNGETGNDILNAQDGISGNDTVDGGDGTDTCTADPGDIVTNCP
jgi:Ca2+-binding RTX toxin-like protein